MFIQDTEVGGTEKKIGVMIWIIFGVFIDLYLNCFSCWFFVCWESNQALCIGWMFYIILGFFLAWCIRLEIKLSSSLVWDNSFSFFDLTYEIIQFVERLWKQQLSECTIGLWFSTFFLLLYEYCDKLLWLLTWVTLNMWNVLKRQEEAVSFSCLIFSSIWGWKLEIGDEISRAWQGLF